MTKRLLLNYRALILVSVAFAATIAYAADFNVRDYGAKPDGSKCTKAFAAAFAAAEKAGGGRVIVPRGKWFTGAIRFKSNCELHLEEGAEVLFSQDPEDYLPAVFTSWEGMECWNYCPLVYAYECTNVAITGKGTLRAYEGRWEDTKWYPWVWQENGIKAARLQLYTWGATDYPVEKREIWKMPNAHTRPHFIQFNRCRNVRLEDFKVRNSPFWTIHLYQCEDASVRGLDVYAHGNNNDGIDIEMSKNVLVEKCVFDQGDDGVVIKSGRNRDAWRIGKPTENVLVRDCEIRNGHSMFGIGSEISGGVRNVTLKDCTAGDVNRIFFLKTNRRRGGFLENITCENVTARSAKTSVFEIATDILYEWADFPDYENRTTRISGITARNISVDSTKDVVRLCGDSSLPPENIRWENVTAKKFTGKELVLNNVAVASTASGETACAADFNVRDYGAKGDGVTDDTAAMQRTIEECAKSGGGRVVVPKGVYMSYTLSLLSNVEFHIEDGAVVRGGIVGEKYPDFAPTTLWRPERSPRFNRKAFFYTVGATNVALTGRGTIDGNSEPFHRWSKESQRFVRISHTNLTGRCVFFVACRGVRVEDVLISRPTGWSTWFLDCDDLRIKRLRVDCDRRFMNGDGIHLGGCRDVVITDCNIESEDDALILRAHQEAMAVPRPLERVLVSNCVFRAQRPCGIRLGWSGDAPIKDVLVTHCRIANSGTGIGCILPPIYRWGNIEPPRGTARHLYCGSADERRDATLGSKGFLSTPEGMIPFSLENVRFEHLDIRAERSPINFEVFAPANDGPQWVWDCDPTPTTPYKDVVFHHCRFYCDAMPSFTPPPVLRFDGLVFDDVQFLPYVTEAEFLRKEL